MSLEFYSEILIQILLTKNAPNFPYTYPNKPVSGPPTLNTIDNKAQLLTP